MSSLPKSGLAVVKGVMSGDSVLLSPPNAVGGVSSADVIFTLSCVQSPRPANPKTGSADEPGAFDSRMWLREMCVGKTVKFDVVKSSPDGRHHGVLQVQAPLPPGPPPAEKAPPLNLALESVRAGHSTPKGLDGENEATAKLFAEALDAARTAGKGVHGPSPLVRRLTSAGEQFNVDELVQSSQKECLDSNPLNHGRVSVLVEHVFDGGRFRCIVTQRSSPHLHGLFTLTLAGVAAPRTAIVGGATPSDAEPYAAQAKAFVEARLLHREVFVSLLAADKNKSTAIGQIHHPMGNISLELLKGGLARCSEWSLRYLNPLEVPSFRSAEKASKDRKENIWKEYSAPTITGQKELTAVVVEVQSGDTISVLPHGQTYDSESKLLKVSLASIRSPRIGNERAGKPDEPYAADCKERLRVLTIGKQVQLTIDYERDIPAGGPPAGAGAAPLTVRRQFATVQVSKKGDVGETLVSEGLATVQRHRDGEARSSRFDELVAVETLAVANKKGMHAGSEQQKKAVVDMTDPKKSKLYFDLLKTAGAVKATVDYVYNGTRFKVTIPKENISIMFALADLRCPQPATNNVTGQKAAEPFGEEAKRLAKLHCLQRSAEIEVTGSTMAGILTGQLHVGFAEKKTNFAKVLVGAGLATIDDRRLESAPPSLVAAQAAAKEGRIGMWVDEAMHAEKEVESKDALPTPEKILTVRISEIRDGVTCYFHVIGDDTVKNIEEKMRAFTSKSGLTPAPCELRKGALIAALFDDGSGPSWYRAYVLEKIEGGGAKVLFVDHGNVASVTARQVRPLDGGLNTIPGAAKPATLALIKVKSLDEDDGIAAGKMFGKLAFGKEMTARVHCVDEGKMLCTLYEGEEPVSINQQLVKSGLARVISQKEAKFLSRQFSSGFAELMGDLVAEQDKAKRARSGMWLYGDCEDDDEF